MLANSDTCHQVPGVVQVDMDGAVDIYRGHGWAYPYADDPLFESGVCNMLALLEQNSIKATFFVIAESLRDARKRALIQAVVAQGHEVASHSLTHAYVRHLDREGQRREIARSRDELQQ